MKKFILAASILICSSAVSAQTNSGPGSVGNLTFSDGGNLFFTTSATAINPAGCAASSYVIGSTNPQFKNYYAMMLTAQATGNDAVIRISNTSCLTLGATNYPRVQLVQVRAN